MFIYGYELSDCFHEKSYADKTNQKKIKIKERWLEWQSEKKITDVLFELWQKKAKIVLHASIWYSSFALLVLKAPNHVISKIMLKCIVIHK